jgi:hypothetical protein
MMHPDPDHNLIRFLKKHQPSPPPASSHCEERLMLLIRQSCPRANPINQFWLVPTAIAASVFLLWSSQQKAFQPVAVNDASHRVNQLNSEVELEAFLVNNWQNLGVETSEANSRYSVGATNDWQLLTNPDSNHRE